MCIVNKVVPCSLQTYALLLGPLEKFQTISWQFFSLLCHSWNHVAVLSHLSWLRQKLLHLIAHMRIHSIFRSLLFDRRSQFDHLAQHAMMLDDNSQWQIPIFKKVTNDPKVVFFFSLDFSIWWCVCSSHADLLSIWEKNVFFECSEQSVPISCIFSLESLLAYEERYIYRSSKGVTMWSIHPGEKN